MAALFKSTLLESLLSWTLSSAAFHNLKHYRVPAMRVESSKGQHSDVQVIPLSDHFISGKKSLI